MRCQIVISNDFIVVDDEKYLIFSNDEMPQNVGFFAFDKEHASDNAKCETKKKYPKILAWLALSSKSIPISCFGTTQG